MTEEKLSKLIKIKDVAELLGVTKTTLRRWDKEGKLKAIRIGQRGHRKYPKTEIERIIMSNN